MFIGNVACCEPGVSGVGWVWIDAGHLELKGYTDEAVGAEGDLVAKRSEYHGSIMAWLPSPQSSRLGNRC